MTLIIFIVYGYRKRGNSVAKISALILAKNEERNIKACIETLSFADEILVIDDFSTDKTKEIAESLGARVICLLYTSLRFFRQGRKNLRCEI